MRPHDDVDRHEAAGGTSESSSPRVSRRLDLGVILEDVLGAAPIAKREHLLEGLCLAVASDGEVRDTELHALRDISRNIPGTPSGREARWLAYLTRVAAEVQVRGQASDRVAALEEAMREEPTRAREEVLAVATLMQYVDGELSANEEDFLNDFAQSLGLSLEEAQGVVDRVEQAVLREGESTRSPS